MTRLMGRVPQVSILRLEMPLHSPSREPLTR
jgi:hypothetical protein